MLKSARLLAGERILKFLDGVVANHAHDVVNEGAGQEDGKTQNLIIMIFISLQTMHAQYPSELKTFNKKCLKLLSLQIFDLEDGGWMDKNLANGDLTPGPDKLNLDPSKMPNFDILCTGDHR